MILLAFDVDGTLDTSAGPVPWAKVRQMAQAMPQVALGIVSPSGARPKDDTLAYIAGSGLRRDNLLAFYRAYPGAWLRIYVSDNGDTAEADAAGFALLTPQQFVVALR